MNAHDAARRVVDLFTDVYRRFRRRGHHSESARQSIGGDGRDAGSARPSGAEGDAGVPVGGESE